MAAAKGSKKAKAPAVDSGARKAVKKAPKKAAKKGGKKAAKAIVIEPVMKARSASTAGGGGNPYHSAALDKSAGGKSVKRLAGAKGKKSKK